MKKFIIGADLSLSSSGICIYNGEEIKFFSYTNAKPNNKWVIVGNDYINYTFHQHKDSKKFTESELLKIKSYDQVTDNIVDDIVNFIGDNDAEMYIESYSYSSKAGKLIDIVTFGTLIRYKLLGYNNIKLNFVPPSSLKKFSGQYAYGTQYQLPKDKKDMCRDESGKAAGSFDKKDLYVVLLNLNLDYGYINFLNENRDDMLNLKNLPKPYDDLNDSLLLVYHGCQEHNIKI